MQLVELLNFYKNRREIPLLAGPSNMICGFKTRFGSIIIVFSAAGGLGFATFFWKVAKKIILIILPASPKL